MRFVVFGFCFCAHSALFADCINAYSCRVPREIARFKREVPRVRMLFPGAPCRASQTVEARARAIDAMADTAIVARLDAPVASSPRAAPSREHERNADALFESRSVEAREVVRARSARLGTRRRSSASSWVPPTATPSPPRTRSRRWNRTRSASSPSSPMSATPSVASPDRRRGGGARLRPRPAPRRRRRHLRHRLRRLDERGLDDRGLRRPVRRRQPRQVSGTPEKIWGSLRSRDHAGAARRFLAARRPRGARVARGRSGRPSRATPTLTPRPSRAEPSPPRAFPLLRQQAPVSIHLARKQRVARGRALESSAAGFAADANALAAVVLVEGASRGRATSPPPDAPRARSRRGWRARRRSAEDRARALRLAGAARERGASPSPSSRVSSAPARRRTKSARWRRRWTSPGRTRAWRFREGESPPRRRDARRAIGPTRRRPSSP